MGIFINQVGFQKGVSKFAVVTKSGEYNVIDNSNDSVVMTLNTYDEKYDASCGENVWKIQFDSLNTEGEYYIRSASDDEKSVLFKISDDVYADLQTALSRVFYYQRCGCALESKYAGIYTHAKCHADKSIFLEDYVNKTENPVKFDLQGGWHDAGDFGRYTTPGAVAVAHLLYAYELFPESFKTELNIPETGNGIPDILNECRYELDWLIKMQAPDGGVYHKLTAYRHAEFIMPEEDHDQFLIYPVSSMAVADYVAVMALASRVYKAFDDEFSNKALEAARKSFDWLLTHDYVEFKNPKEVNTGEYDDDADEDERMWAAAEMLRTDKSGKVDEYRKMLEKYVYSSIPKTDFGWTDVAGFTLLAVLTDNDHSAGKDVEDALYNAMIKEADRLTSLAEASGFGLCMEIKDYVWGSNMVVCNRSMLLILSYLLSKESGSKKMYKEVATDCLHYLLGRNILDRSYVTGFGEKAYRNPHNRVTACDNIDDPMPGWVSGGPFKTPCDPDALSIIPAGTAPMKCHADLVGSYSTNEITIYWNSPAVFITAFLNANL